MLAVIASAAMVACGGDGGRSSAADGVAARCGVEDDATLSGDGIGALRIGATVEQVTLACRVLADTLDPLGPEGQPERSLVVGIGDRPDTVRAVVVGDSVWRLHVAGDAPRAADSLGVGSLVRDLRVRRDARLIRGEGGLFVVMADPCGMSFRLGQPDGAAAVSLASVADSVRVTEVLVTGCR